MTLYDHPFFLRIAKQLLKTAQRVRRNGRDRLDHAPAITVRASLRECAHKVALDSLTRHFDHAEFADIRHRRLRTIISQAIHTLFDQLSFVGFQFHIDEVNHDDSAQIA